MLERFLKYVKINTKSNDEVNKTPSTDSQIEFAKILLKDLEELNVEASLDEYGFIYGVLRGNIEGSIGFISHMDTALELEGNCNPQVINNYDGSDINLGEYVLSANEYPSLKENINKTIITTDGNTLLGADDKAGIVEIFEMLKYYKDNKNHKDIYIAFTPDEEIGMGIKKFNVDKFKVDYAYTVDGNNVGDLEFENFNAAVANINVNGISIHPGDAKDKMINASKVLMEFNSLLPKDLVPEKTKGYEGFNHLLSINGDVSNAKAQYIIRNHDKELFEKQINEFKTITKKINDSYKKEIVSVDIKIQYLNMKEIIEKDLSIIELAKRGIIDAGYIPNIKPIRGGTDGAQLTYMGIPCPNLGVGGYNFHSRFEYISLENMEAVSRILISMVKAHSLVKWINTATIILSI